MDIAILSSVMSQSALSQAASIRVLSMAKNQAILQGQQLVQMMNTNLDPNLGRNLDVRV